MRSRSPILFVCLAIGLGLPAIVSTGLGRPTAGLSRASLPTPFRITPARNGLFFGDSVLYNPKLDRYVVFFDEQLSGWKQEYFSRVLDANGQPLCGAQKIFSSDPGLVGIPWIAYNPREDTFFFVSITRKRSIYGLALDSRGRPLGGRATPISIKGDSGEDTIVRPNVAWIPSINQFAVSWISSKTDDPANSRNGYYLAMFDNHFKKVFGPRKVREQSVKNCYNLRAFVLPLEDKLLWGSADDAQGSAMKPILWFTDFKGEVLESYGKKGLVYPGDAVPYGGWVRAALDPDHGVVLLYWTYSDHSNSGKMKYWENSTRMMSTDGVFKTSVFKMPRRQPFQSDLIAEYAEAEKRFFLVCQEYIIFSNSSYYQFGGKLWGFYMDEKGRLENKQGKHVVAPIPLTETNLDPHGRIYLGDVASRPEDNSFFIFYGLNDRQSNDDQVWGLIYK